MTDVPGLDTAGLTRWIAAEHPELVAGDDPATPLTATLIAGGRSNLTYRVDGAARPLVLRRPPLGHVLSSAHDMFREHRVIDALRDSAVPVPDAIDVVDDTADARVTGTPFFLMERVEGVVLNDRRHNAGRPPAALHRLGLELAEVLAELHSVDPDRVGLDGFGRGDGYLDRQLATWRRQYDASRSRELPALDELQHRLGERRPEASVSTLVHGDYRLDNAIVAGPVEAPRIAAILDWEMATIGDPLVDLGMLGLYWTIADLPGGSGIAPSSVDPVAGYPSFDELVDAYAARLGRRAPDLAWYRAFAAYKLAVILEGIHFRFQAGGTVGDGFDRIGELVEPLTREGLAWATRRAATAPAAAAASAGGIR
ncbi:phosphotransferase family protein [Agromyces intestinalis]|uniref:Phosphotransferase family protein n=1 Tax=Agromyces intestinalis TaxID=2592652 RepID=A0A5C1YG19_9MICO|nr:phosphotransferase family protein [Agromyces intestinalis]QEO14981.1 phosphotransferase family protein [Agromyces intestinalis]